MRLDSADVTAIKRLADNPDFKRFLKGLDDYHEVLVHQLISCPGDQLPTAQGRAQSILRVITAVRDAIDYRPQPRT